MICSKCGKENAEEMLFCVFCGSHLQGKVQCSKCGAWVDQTYQYCPLCANKLGKDHSVEPKIQEMVPERENTNGHVKRNKLVSIITNSLVILFSALMVAFMFDKLAVMELEDFGLDTQTSVYFKIDLFDYVGTTIKSLSDYSSEDFIREINELGANDAETEEEAIELISQMNFLNIFVVNELDKAFILERIFIYVNLAIAIAMLVLPLVALGLSIYDLVKFQKRNVVKNLLVFSFLLGLILVITTTLMMNYRPTSTVIFYMVFAALGLISNYIFENVAGERKFVGKVFATRLVTSLALVILFILSTTTVATFHFERKLGLSTENYSMALDFSDFAGSMDNFENVGNLSYFMMQFYGNPLSLITGISEEEEADPINHWVSYVDFGFAILMLIVIGLLITLIIIETFRNTNLRPKKPPILTLLFTWLAFGFEILAMISIIVIIITYNSYFKEFNLNGFSFKIGAGIIAFMTFTLATALYQTMAYKIENQTLVNI